MITNNSILNNNPSSIPINTTNLTSNLTPTVNTASKSKEIQSNSPSLNNLAYIIDEDLKVRTNSVELAFKEASNGAALSQVTNLALVQQNDILTNISDKLKYILKNETSDTSKESIRKDIVKLLDTFDKIAADSNYKELYSLQESNISTNTSHSYSFRLSEVPPVVLSTSSIQSNTSGLGLEDLKNLSQDGLTNPVAYTQSGIVTTAIKQIDQFQSDFKNLLNTFKSSTNSLSQLHKSFEKSNENTIEINFKFESLTFDRNKILKEMGNFSQIQANALQSSVIDLLTFDTNTLNKFNSPASISIGFSSNSEDTK